MYENNKDSFEDIDGFGDIWSQIAKPFKEAGSWVETKIIRPTIGSKGIGKPLSVAAKQAEKYIIRPTLGKAIKPIAKIMPKITIGGHRYDLGGHQMLQKTVTGAVAGAASYSALGGAGWAYGAVYGAVAANLRKGKPDVLKDLGTGAAGGAVGAAVTAYATPSVAAAETAGGTAAATTAGGTTAAEVIGGVGAAGAAASTIVDVGSKTGLIRDKSGNVIAEVAEVEIEKPIQAGFMDFLSNNKSLAIAIGLASVMGVISIALDKKRKS
jgi:hypothetical protein